MKDFVEKPKNLATNATPSSWCVRNEPEGEGKFRRLISANSNPDGSPKSDFSEQPLNGGMYVVETRGRDAINNAKYIAEASPENILVLLENREKLVFLLERAREELRLIRAKDSGAVYDATLRTEINIFLSGEI